MKDGRTAWRSSLTETSLVSPADLRSTDEEVEAAPEMNTLSKTCHCIKCQRLAPRQSAVSIASSAPSLSTRPGFFQPSSAPVMDGVGGIHYLPIRRRAEATEGEMPTIWEAVCEGPPDPKGLTTLTSTLLARAGAPFEVLT